MEKQSTVYFSNQLEVLASSLAKELWGKKSDPLARSLVILPHHGLKSYLHRFFAREDQMGISMGLECKVLMESLTYLLPNSSIFPSETAFSFAIEHLLELMGENPIFSPVKKYLEGQANPRAISWLSCELAKIFYEYAVFEPKLLSTWKKGSSWQQEIWDKIFALFPTWRCLAEALRSMPSQERQIHLFGFSHLPTHFYDFFCGFHSTWYFLSPSEMFWEDLCSDKERIYLEKKMEKGKVRLQVQQQLRFFLTKTHPLLANWGSTGKALLALFGKTESYMQEKYIKKWAEGTLGFLQKSILELDDEEDKVEVPMEDTSLLCMSATSPLREVEILSQTLEELQVLPKDVLVLVSDFSIYEPYIHMVFGAKQSPFPYCIHGLSYKGGIQSVIQCFVEMVERRFDRTSMEKFFYYPSVRRRWEFTEEDIDFLVKEWEKAGIFWGITVEHKKTCLAKTSCERGLAWEESLGGTWEEGILRMLRGLAVEERLFASPEWTMVEVLGRSIECILHITRKCGPIYLEEKKSFSFWVEWIQDFLSTHTDLDLEIQECIQEMRLLEKQLEAKELVVPFPSFLRAIQTYGKRKKTSFHSHLTQAVTFAPLEMGGAHPAQVLYVLGCDVQSLPPVCERSSLEEIQEKKQVPSWADQSRYLCLELILHARKHLVFSYTRISAEDQKPQGACSMIEEMFAYIDSRCFFLHSALKPSRKYTRHHPTLSFAKEYFAASSPFPCFSRRTFGLALSYFHKEKQDILPFFPSWHTKVERNNAREKKIVIEIKQLEEFATHPLRLYFKQKLGLYIQSAFEKDSEFFLQPTLKKNVLCFHPSAKKDIAPYLPLGRWKDVAQKQLEEEMQDTQCSLKMLGSQESEMMIIEWVEGIKKIEFSVDRIIFPACRIAIGEEESIFLQGCICHATAEGFLWFGKKKKQEYFALWPSFLLFLCAAKELGWKERCWLVQEKKLFPYVPKDPYKELAEYVKLYLRSIEEPCPVAPSWALQFLEKEGESWKNTMRSEAYEGLFQDPYEEWIKRRDPQPDPLHVQGLWQEQWMDVFASLTGSSVDEDL